MSAVVLAQSKFAARREFLFTLTLALLVQTGVSILGGSVGVLAPAIAYERHWNLAVAALYAPTLYIGAFCINFCIPQLLNGLSGIGLALGAIAVAALGLACLLSPWPPMAVLAALLIGLGWGAITPASSQILGPRVTAQNAGRIMSVKQIGVPMGTMLAGLVLPDLVFHLGWRRTIADVAALSVMLAVALLPTVSWLNRIPGQASTGVRPLDPIRRLLMIPGMRALLAATFVYVATQLCLRSLLTTYLVRDTGMDLSAAGPVLGFSQGAGMLGQVFWAWLSDRLMTPHTVLAIVGVVTCAGVLAMASFSPRWSVAAVLSVSAVVGLGASGFLPVVLGEIARLSPPGQVGALTSGANIFVMAGACLGPLTFGGIGSALSYRASFVVFAVAIAMVAAALFATRPNPPVAK